MQLGPAQLRTLPFRASGAKAKFASDASPETPAWVEGGENVQPKKKAVLIAQLKPEGGKVKLVARRHPASEPKSTTGERVEGSGECRCWFRTHIAACHLCIVN